ncbi:SAG family member [Eimeria tenella]|uniref:SAG family member n=1 Tax=Eimeria tenella TaxID=5802 RepID=U6KRM0_EIMTE|nr:SAG family member [Eimeria tenella]CDJ40616.1 SAG family member [Eimeria tenella]|eukprot:XP_013231366.1 SAG family member [Eimeria tenella]
MFRVNLASFLGVSLLVLSEKSSEAAAGTTVNYTAKIGGSVECLGEVNAAREAAGFANFIKAETEKEKITDPGSTELPEGGWKDLCEHLIPAPPEAYNAQTSAEAFQDGTYAFKSLADADPNCKETVDYWKAAYKNFTGLPPSKSKDEKLYNNQDNVSFVALYNPSSNATADCRVVTCTQTNTTTPQPDTVSRDGNTEATKKGYALICKTTPAAFENDASAPFTQEQWDKIRSSLTGSASVAAPSLVALAIVTFGITTL